MDRNRMIAVAIAAGVLCFGGGALTMQVIYTDHPFSHGSARDGDQGVAWPIFG